MPKKPLNIGIVTSDPAIGCEIYREIIGSTRRYTLNYLRNPNISVYSRTLANSSPQFNIYEGTETMRRLNMYGGVVFPDLDVNNFIGSSTGNIPNRLPLIAPLNIPAMTSDMVSGIEDNVLSRNPPREGTDKRKKYDRAMAAISAWADFITDVAFWQNDLSLTAVSRNRERPDDKIASAAVDPARHKNGFIAIQGGQGPEAGNESLRYLAQNSKAALLLVSQPSVPNPVAYIMELRDKGLHQVAAKLNPLPSLHETSRRISSLNPDAKIIPCNSLHCFENLFVGSGDGTVDLIEAGVRSIEIRHGRKNRVLLLGTDSTINEGIYQKKAKDLGRNDIEFLLPDTEQQSMVMRAIFDEIIPGDYEKGRKTLLNVIEHFRSRLFDITVLTACSDLPIVLGGVKNVLDPSEAAAGEAIQIATDKASNRSGGVTIWRGSGGKRTGNTKA